MEGGDIWLFLHLTSSFCEYSKNISPQISVMQEMLASLGPQIEEASQDVSKMMELIEQVGGIPCILNCLTDYLDHCHIPFI